MSLDMPQPVQPARRTQPFLWSVRREVWENPSLIGAPLIAAGVVLFGQLIGARFLVAGAKLTWNGRQAAFDPGHMGSLLGVPHAILAVAVVATAFIAAWFRCLRGLHSERQDRSILFWRSMPVSDLTAVAAKMFVALVLSPLAAFAVLAAGHLALSLLEAVVLASHGLNASAAFIEYPLITKTVEDLYLLLGASLWWAPVWAWALLVSSWARGGTFLWAVGPWLGLALFERLALDSAYVMSMLSHRIFGVMDAVKAPHEGQTAGVSLVDFVHFLGEPQLWIGLIAAAAFLAGAVQLRRRGGVL